MHLSYNYISKVYLLLLLLSSLSGSIKAGASEHALFSNVMAVPSGQDVYIKAVLSKEKVFVGEPLTVEFVLYHRKPIIDPQHELTVEFDDAFVEEYPVLGSTRHEQVNGENYQVVSLKKYLVIPQLEGKLKVPAISKLFKVNVPPAPDDFFGVDRIVEQKVTSAIKTVDVMPLPAPTDSIPFSKAIGKFTFSGKYTVSGQSTAMLTFKLEAIGKGNLKYASLVLPELPDAIALYNEEQKSEQTLKPEGLHSKATFTYQFAANYQGEYTIPAITFLYFDPETATYERYTTQPFTWQVTHGPLKPADKAVATEENVPAELIIKDELNANNSQLFIHSFAFYGILLLSGLLFALAFLYKKRAAEIAANPLHYRFKRAKKKAVRSLQKLKTNCELDHESFYKNLNNAVELYFCAKLYLPPDSFTLSTLEAKLAGYKVPEQVSLEMVQQLQSLYAIRFSTGQERVGNRSVYCDRFIHLIKTVDKYLYEEIDLTPVLVR